MAPVPLRRPDRRRVRTRSALIAAGERLFAQQPMDAVTIDDIVIAADVAKGSFYNHFDDKSGLIDAIVSQVQQECEDAIGAANTSIADPAERMARALCVAMGYGHDHPDRLQALISLSQRRTVADSPLNAGVAADVSAGLAQQRFVGVTVETGILLALGVISIAVAHAITRASPTPEADIARQMAAALLRALGVAAADAEDIAMRAVAEIMLHNQ